MFRLSCAVLLYSFVLVASYQGPSILDNWSFQGWVHLLLLPSLIYGIWRARRMKSSADIKSLGSIPIWLWFATIAVIFVTAQSWFSSSPFPNTTATGALITKNSLYQEGDRYYRTENLGSPIQISKDEYRARDRRVRLSFSRSWVLGWYLSMVIWYVVYLADRKHPIGAKAGGDNQSLV